MMLIFLDKRKRIKYDLISFLSSNESKPFTIYELQQATKSSIPTLTKLLNELSEDLVNHYGDTYLVENLEGNQKKYTFKKQSNFILNELLFIYLSDSLKFRLIQDLFHTERLQIDDLAESYFVSTSTLRREVLNLKQLLLSFDIELKGYTHLSLAGEEGSIRLFYSYFFVNTYQAKEWPFPNIPYYFLTKLHDYFPDSLCPPEDIQAKIFITYSLAISYTRHRQGHFLPDNFSAPLFFDEDSPTFMEAHQELIDFLYPKIMDDISLENLTLELKFNYSLIFCYLEYHNDFDIFPALFMTHKFFQEDSFMGNIYRDSFILFKTLNLPEKATTFYEVLFKIATLHYRVLFFGKAFEACFDQLQLGNNQFEQSDNYFYIAYHIIREKIQLPFYQDPWITAYYIKSYSIIGSHLIVNSFHQQHMNVLLIANQLDYQYIVNTIRAMPLDPYLTINFVTAKKNKLIDVVISDSAFNPELINTEKVIPVIYFEPTSHNFSVKNIINQLIELHWKEVLAF